MRILKMSAYYAPEQTSSSHLTADLNRAFLEAGFTIENFVPTPTRGVSKEVRAKYKKIKYEEQENGQVIVHRFSMFREGRNPIQRALRYFLVNLAQYWKGSRAKGIDLIYAGSTPPTQGLLCGMVKKKRKVPFVYNLQDIFPDSLVNAKMTKKGSLLWKIGRKIENFTYRHADIIIVISESMKRNIMEKGVPEEKIVLIPNWIDTDAVQPVSREENPLFDQYGLDREKFTVVYAGNFGAMQGTGVILQAAQLLKDRGDIQFVLFGGGAEFASAKKAVEEEQLTNVTIDGLLPQERVPEVYSLGDVALITCKKGTGTSAMPSKTWSIMACSTPIIAAFDTDSDLAEILSQSGTGITVEPENARALADAIVQKAEEHKNGSLMSCGREYVCAHASRTICTSRYVQTLQEVLAKNN